MILAIGETKATFNGQTWTRATFLSALKLARTIVKLGAIAEVYENGRLIRKLATNGFVVAIDKELTGEYPFAI